MEQLAQFVSKSFDHANSSSINNQRQLQHREAVVTASAPVRNNPYQQRQQLDNFAGGNCETSGNAVEGNTTTTAITLSVAHLLGSATSVDSAPSGDSRTRSLCPLVLQRDGSPTSIKHTSANEIFFIFTFLFV